MAARLETREGIGGHPLLLGAGIVIALTGLLLLALNAADQGFGGTALGLALSTLPAPILVALVLALDRLEPEPPRLLALTFLWGATVAVLFATIVNTAGGEVVGGMFGQRAGEVFLVSISAPFVEEVLKAAALLLVFRLARHELNGLVDGVVYAGMVGLGFAVGENVHYYADALASGDTALVLVVRGVFTPFAHPLFTAMFGLGLAYAAETRGTGRRVRVALLGLLAAIVVHAAWNSAFFLTRPVLLAIYFLVFWPLLIGVLLVLRKGVHREGRIIRTELAPLVVHGTLDADDVEALGTLRGRRAALARAEAAAGAHGKRAARELAEVATELAFRRHLAGGAVSPADAADITRLAALQARASGRPSPSVPTTELDQGAAPCPIH